MDIADVLARKQPRRQQVTIILDADVERRLGAAEDAARGARARAQLAPKDTAAAADLAQAEADLEAAQGAADEASVTFVFEALGRQQFSDLRGEHPPTKEQRTEWKKRWLRTGMVEHQIPELEHNTDTFPPVLIAASCIEPVMTVGQATDLWNSAGWSDAELAELFGTALLVNQQHRRHDLGNAFR